MDASTLMDRMEFEAAHRDLLRCYSAPFYCERDNSSGVEVRDCRGDVIFEENYDFGPDHGAATVETAIKSARAVARFLVAASRAEFVGRGQ